MDLDLKDKKVTVIGARRSGVAVANLVSRLNGFPKISDQGTPESSQTDLENLIAKDAIPMEWGGHSQEFIEDSDLLVLSPGVRIDALPVRWARAKQIPVIGEIELAWKFCPIPVIAVTGSNGKTTTVHLISKILEKAGKRVCLCGNVGNPFSQHVLELNDKDFVVLEISSFQLESIIDFKPFIALMLNFSQNHLDRHKDIEEYFAAKNRIFMNQDKNDYALLNFDEPRLKTLARGLKAKTTFFNSPEVLKNTTVKNPNQLAALAAAKILNIDESLCREVFKEFKGVEHRLELVRTLGEVDYINDSKATTAEAGRWALQSISNPIIMICGGKDKNIDFSVLKSLVKQRVKRMLAIGEAREKIRQTFQDTVEVEECPSLERALWRARDMARAGDCVLLCPMCASFDMFKDYEDRGRTFKEIVAKL